MEKRAAIRGIIHVHNVQGGEKITANAFRF